MKNTMTTTRKFDPKIWGFDKRQQILVLLLLVPLSLSFMGGCLTFGPEIGMKISVIVGIIEGLFFLLVGRTSESLYHFECALSFLLSIHQGDDYIFKHEELKGNYIFKRRKIKKLYDKIKKLSRIVKIHNGGYVEYLHTRRTPHNMGLIGKLETHQPEDLEAFANAVEPILLGLDDKSMLITTLKVRSDMTDYAKPIRDELQRDRIPQIVRDSMFEHQQMCEEADEKSYKNHMLILNPYTANHKKAMNSLDISFESIQEHLKELGIGYNKLDTKEKVIEMFHEDLTYGVHNMESVKNG